MVAFFKLFGPFEAFSSLISIFSLVATIKDVYTIFCAFSHARIFENQWDISEDFLVNQIYFPKDAYPAKLVYTNLLKKRPREP